MTADECLLSLPIRDVSVLVGGQAGGQKYTALGIFFKRASDELKIYGGEEYAKKTCSHELKAMSALLQCNTQGSLGLHFPMACVVDFMGVRMLAMSEAPLKGSKTLVYGSKDQALTVRRRIMC